MKTVIIGGVAAGMSAASKLKRLDPDCHVLVIEKGYETSYGACGLPYYVSGVNPGEDLLRIRKPGEFISAGIDLNLGCQARGVDFKAGSVEVEDIETGQIRQEGYDNLVITTGAESVVPRVPGTHLKNIFTLKTIMDANLIKAALSKNVRRVVVVGGGYIGLEMVECFLHLGLSVDLVEAADRVLTTFDGEFSEKVQQWLEAQGVSLHLNEAVIAFEGNESVRTVVTPNGSYQADLVLIAVGVRPNTGFLGGALDRLANGAVLVDKEMAASIPGVWAAGDCASVWHRLLEKQTHIPLATGANKQGRFLAENILGARHAYETAVGTAMIKIGDLELGRTGLSEGEARANGIECFGALVHGTDRAPYYPGGSKLTVKFICRKDTGCIIGAQFIGKSGAALRINTIAACITAGMTAAQIGEMDFGYAPPYAMPWDVMHVAANVADSIYRKMK